METIVKRKRPKVLAGTTYEIQTGCGALYVTINSDDNGLFELFATIGKQGGCAASQAEAIGRLISLALRSGITIKQLLKQLQGISCHSPIGVDKEKVTSCADAIGKVIKMHTEAQVTTSRVAE